MRRSLLSVMAVSMLLVGGGLLVYRSRPDSPDPETTCKSMGGFWLSQSARCSLPTSDGGQECADSSECESYCYTKGVPPGTRTKGTCLEFTIPNCIDEVKNGIVQESRCEGVFR